MEISTLGTVVGIVAICYINSSASRGRLFAI